MGYIPKKPRALYTWVTQGLTHGLPVGYHQAFVGFLSAARDLLLDYPWLIPAIWTRGA